MKTIIKKILALFKHKKQRSKNVALVLSGGGARGYFHIGAIEALEERGYTITSVAGTSMGALIGGAYANGHLNELKQLFLSLNKKKILQLLDVSMGLDHITNGERLMQTLDNVLGNAKIEQLKVPFTCCASDIVSGEERVFTSGLLRTAVRASISIPGFFKPVKENGHIYVDGSVHNTLPLDRVVRNENDLLLAINVNGADTCPYMAYLKNKEERKDKEGIFRNMVKHLPFYNVKFSANYMNMAVRISSMAIQANTQLALRLTPPEILVELPMNLYSMFDFNKAAELIAYGKEEMARQLEAYEQEM